MSKESFLESLRKGKANAAVLSDEPAPVPVSETPVPSPVEKVSIPKPAAAEVKYDTVALSDARSVEAGAITAAMNQELNTLGLTPMQVVAIMTRAGKELEAVIERFNDDASKEFEARMAADPTAVKLIVGGAEWTRNQNRTTWKYSPAVAALQEKEKAEGIAKSSTAVAKKSFKLTIVKEK